MAPLVLQEMEGSSSYGAKPSLILLSLYFMYRTPEMFCAVRWALLLLALLERAYAGTGRANLSWLVPGMHSFLHVIGRFKLVKLQPLRRCGLAQYGTVLVQWYVVHSHERRLAGGMIDEEFEVCFELHLSVLLAKLCMWYRGCRCGFTYKVPCTLFP
jgi:hypothetical protein